MKKCPVCGKEWSDATRFCGSCGAKLEDGNIVVPDIVPDDGKEEQRKKTEPVKPSVKKTQLNVKEQNTINRTPCCR